MAYKYRFHDPRLGRFLSVDPLKHEFSWNSPYAFSENRVIDGIEFEGLEVVKLNKNKDEVFYDTGINYRDPDPDTEHFFTHGGSSATNVSDVTIENFDQYMSGKSEKWRNRKNGKTMVMVLHSCWTGEPKGELPSYGANLSKKYTDAIFIAPDGATIYTGQLDANNNFIEGSGSEYGNYLSRYPNDSNTEPLPIILDGSVSTIKGKWNVYYKGEKWGEINKNSNIKGVDVDAIRQTIYMIEGMKSWERDNLDLPKPLIMTTKTDKSTENAESN